MYDYQFILHFKHNHGKYELKTALSDGDFPVPEGSAMPVKQPVFLLDSGVGRPWFSHTFFAYAMDLYAYRHLMLHIQHHMKFLGIEPAGNERQYFHIFHR